jgi:HK97 family phage prohead protease
MREYLSVPLEIKALDEGEPGTFSGYGSVFANVDSYGDVVAKGAFKDTLKEWKTKGKLPPMLLQHGGGFFGGSAGDLVPIGKWTDMHEDDYGLAVTGKLIAMDTERTKQVYGAMKEGALDGLSIGYRTKQVDLVELSVVTFPANGESLVESVKALPEFESVKALEDWLREVLGLGQKERKTFISQLRTLLRRDVDATDATAAVIRKIESLTAAVKGAAHVGSSGSREAR